LKGSEMEVQRRPLRKSEGHFAFLTEHESFISKHKLTFHVVQRYGRLIAHKDRFHRDISWELQYSGTR